MQCNKDYIGVSAIAPELHQQLTDKKKIDTDQNAASVNEIHHAPVVFGCASAFRGGDQSASRATSDALISQKSTQIILSVLHSIHL